MPDRPNSPRSIPLHPSRPLRDPRDSKSYRNSLRRVASTPLKVLPNRRHPPSGLLALAKSLERTPINIQRKPTPPSNFLFISNLNDNVTPEYLQRTLAKHAVVRKIHIPEIKNRRQGLASVQLSSAVDAKAVAAKINDVSMCGQKINAMADPYAKRFNAAWKQKTNPPKRTRKPPNPVSSNLTLCLTNIHQSVDSHKLLNHLRDFHPTKATQRTPTTWLVHFQTERERDEAYRKAKRRLVGMVMTISHVSSSSQSRDTKSRPDMPSRSSSELPSRARSAIPSRARSDMPSRPRSDASARPLTEVTSRTDRSRREHASKPDMKSRSDFPRRSDYHESYSRSKLPPRSNLPPRVEPPSRPEAQHRFSRPAYSRLVGPTEHAWRRNSRWDDRHDAREKRGSVVETKKRNGEVSSERKAATRPGKDTLANGISEEDGKLTARKQEEHRESDQRDLKTTSTEKLQATEAATYTEEELHNAAYEMILSRIVDHIASRRMLKHRNTIARALGDFVKQLDDDERKQKENAQRERERQIEQATPSDRGAVGGLQGKAETEPDITSDRNGNESRDARITPAHCDIFEYLNGTSIPKRRVKPVPQRKRTLTATPTSLEGSQSTSCAIEKDVQEVSKEDAHPRKRMRRSRFSDAASMKGAKEVPNDDEGEKGSEKETSDLKNDRSENSSESQAEKRNDHSDDGPAHVADSTIEKELKSTGVTNTMKSDVETTADMNIVARKPQDAAAKRGTERDEGAHEVKEAEKEERITRVGPMEKEKEDKTAQGMQSNGSLEKVENIQVKNRIEPSVAANGTKVTEAEEAERNEEADQNAAKSNAEWHNVMAEDFYQKSMIKDSAERKLLEEWGFARRVLRSSTKNNKQEAKSEARRDQGEARQGVSGKTQVAEETESEDAVLVLARKRSLESLDDDEMLEVAKGSRHKRRKVPRRCTSSVTPESSSRTVTEDTKSDIKEAFVGAKKSAGSHEREEALHKDTSDSESEGEGESARTCGISLSEWRARKSERPRKYIQQAVDVVSSSRDNRQRNRILRKGIRLINPKHDILTVNNLKQRKKAVQYRKSEIHGMGLFACEQIEPREFILEYIGQIVRSVVADIREAAYTRRGMGDSYLFRLPGGMMVDATHTGGIARFINHSCDPNVIARIISVDGQAKIVFYSKRVIKVDEELTYDYKFDFEDDDKKIPCLCRAASCRKFLN